MPLNDDFRKPDLSVGAWTRIAIRVLDGLVGAAHREHVPVAMRHRIEDAVIAVHDVRRMLDG